MAQYPNMHVGFSWKYTMYFSSPQDRREYKKFLDDMHTGDFTPVSSDYYTCACV